MPETPEKSANPSTVRSVQTSASVVLNTIAQVAQRSWVQARPTLLQGMQVLTRSFQTWSTQLEIQEKTAQARGTVPAQAIDWTPVKNVTDIVWTKAQPLWQRLLILLRPRLPESFQPLSDRSLSGILVGVLLLVLWFISIVPSGQAAPPPDSPQVSREANRQANREANRQADRQARRKALARDYNADNGSDDRSDYRSDDRSDSSISAAIPSNLSSPIAQPLAQPAAPMAQPIAQQAAPIASTSAPSTTPALETLSPDAQKRAKLRQDLDVIAGSLMDNAIVGIRPQFDSHFLAVTLNDRWYVTPESIQDKLANSLLVIAQIKDFTQIQLEASDGTVLARNPVVGDGMIILQRSR